MGASFKQQTGALVQKSWVFQRRNIFSNICLCVAPIFFCVILAIIQALVNRLLTSSSDLKCGCFCQQCCPQWALSSKANNYTSDGNGTITITNPALWGGFAGISQFFPPQSIVNNTDGTYSIYACAPVSNGICPSDDGFTCLKTDSSTCGVQFSSPSQSEYCAVPQPSVWPAMTQTPPLDRRAMPWNNSVVNGTVVNRPATLITGASATFTSSVGGLLYPGSLSTDNALWNQALNGPDGLNTGNVSDPNFGNVYNGNWLTVLGMQFGTSARPQNSLYVENSFAPGSSSLYAMFPANLCVAKNITTNSTVCLSALLKRYFAGTPTASAPWLQNLPPCNGGLLAAQNISMLVNTPYVSVYCTENAVEQTSTTAQLENLLYCGYYQARCANMTTWINQEYQGAFDLGTSNTTALNINVYYNQTKGNTNGGQPDNALRIPGAVNLGVTSWWAAITGGSNAPPDTSMQLLGSMGMPTQARELNLDFSSLLGPLFFCWVVQLLFPTFLQQLVYEKEKRLRMMMKMHGLGDGVYWLVTYLWYLLLYCLYILIFIIIGAAVRLKIFTKTNLGIQIIFYFLQGNCMIAFAFFLSSVFSSSRTAIVVAFLYVFGSGLIGELLLKPFMEENKSWIFFTEWVPAFALYRGLFEMAAYSFIGVYRGEPGMQFSNLSDDGNGMVTTWAIFVVEWAIFLILGLYLEQVVSSGTGIRRHPLFFLEWMWRKKEQHAALHGEGSGKLHTAVGMQGGLKDVEAERERVEALTDYADVPIVVRDLQKTYPALDGGKPKVAVRSLTLGVNRGECFGLLGPNGAGKSTSINMLVGFLDPSGGDAIIEGFDIRKDMQQIYKLMGVCPQHDLLWEQLTGREHLRFYGRLKGLTGSALDGAIDEALKGVNLYNVGNKFAGKYSGGMKRRLSVAISFIGSPQVVYLDEPSTGLDPASRRNLWEVVKTSKEGRSIILTTHSMEEAEQLCDRLGIFVDGQLVCIGNPKEITSRYAGFFVFTISVPAAQEQQARDLVLSMSPNAALTYSLGGTLKYELPTSEVTLSQVFAAVNKAKGSMDIIDWGVANATLEEVFIKMARSGNIKSSDH